MTVPDRTAEHAHTSHPNAALAGLLVCALAVLYVNAFGPPMPAPGDLALALPISKELAQPGLYSTQDLIVSSGQRMPFHVYRFAGLLYSMELNVDRIWQALHQVFLFLTFHAIWTLALIVARAPPVAAISVAIVAGMSFLRGGLHWSSLPLTSMITAQVAQPLAIYALAALFSRRFLLALIVASLTFNIHPYVGLLTILAVSVVIIFHVNEVPFLKRVGWLALGALVALPNALFILRALPQNVGIGSDAPSNQDFFDQFRVYAWHAFPADHWWEGYGWVALNLAGLGFATRFLDAWARRAIFLIVGALLAAMGVYVLNLYTAQVKILLLMFLFRATYLTKPLMIVGIVGGLYAWLKAASPKLVPVPLALGVVLMFALMAFSPNILRAEAMGLIAYAIILGLIGTARRERVAAGAGVVAALGILGLSAAGKVTFSVHLYAVIVIVAFAITNAVLFLRLRPDSALPRVPPAVHASPPHAALTFLSVIVLGLCIHTLWTGSFSRWTPRTLADMNRRAQLSEPDPILAGVTEWARTQTPVGSLFCVPPTEPLFELFRLQAERGLYAAKHDINQLAFDTSIYREAHERLMRIGVRVTRRHRFDESGYHALPIQEWGELHANAGVRFVVFYVPALGEQWSPIRPAYYDGTFVAFDLSTLPVNAGAPRG